MRSNDSIEMRLIDGRSRNVYSSTADAVKQTNSTHVLNNNNSNNNNNNQIVTSTTGQSQRNTVGSGDDSSEINSLVSPFDSLNQQKIAKSYPNLPGQLRRFDHVTNRGLSGSVPTLATGNSTIRYSCTCDKLVLGITASPNFGHPMKTLSNSSESKSFVMLLNGVWFNRMPSACLRVEGSTTRLSDIASQDAPVGRLCRIRKFPTSPFYGFFLCGDPKKLG